MSVISPVEGVADFLLQGKNQDDVALLTLTGQHTYGELRSAALVVANYLRLAGAKKSERVLLIGENSFFWVAAYLGILRSGLVCVPLSSTISELELGYALQVTEAKFAFLQGSAAHRNSALFSEISVVLEQELPGLVCGKTLDHFPGLLSRL